MNQRIAKRTTGLVDYEELETNVLSAIRAVVLKVNKKNEKYRKIFNLVDL